MRNYSLVSLNLCVAQFFRILFAKPQKLPLVFLEKRIEKGLK